MSDIFVIFPNLIFLNLPSSALNYLDENSFKNTSSLEELYLGYGNINSLKNGTFIEALNLRLLYLNNNKLRTIDIDAFARLIQLKYLNLDDNELTHIHPQIFQNLTNLLGLSLANNYLTELHISTFQQFKNLEELDLSGNHFKSLDGNLLSSNNRLKLLYINDCGIEAVGRKFFDNLKLLTFVYGEANVCIDKDFYEFNNISSVVPEFQQCFNNYDRLKVDLCYYKVDPKLGYTCEMRNVTYLNDTQGLSISGTHITDLQDTDVVAVKFINSTLSKIPSTIFRKFTNLVRLSVKQVGLKKLDNNTFEECGKLKEFDASFNEISEINNNAFDKCKSLTNIDLSDNVLRVLRNQVFTGTN
ncbi:unnamed protein product [Diamesa tonsa]